MALLHSRVSEVFYLCKMEATGGLGGCAGVPGLEGVNHRFRVWKWIGDGDGEESGVEVLQVDRGIDA